MSYTPPFTITDEILNLVAEIFELLEIILKALRAFDVKASDKSGYWLVIGR